MTTEVSNAVGALLEALRREVAATGRMPLSIIDPYNNLRKLHGSALIEDALLERIQALLAQVRSTSTTPISASQKVLANTFGALRQAMLTVQDYLDATRPEPASPHLARVTAGAGGLTGPAVAEVWRECLRLNAIVRDPLTRSLRRKLSAIKLEELISDLEKRGVTEEDIDRIMPHFP